MIYPSITTHPAFRGYITVPKKAGGVRHYNGSACRHDGKIFHAWRNETADGHSRIWLGELDIKTRAIRKAVPLDLGDDCDAEDPRLWSENGVLMLGWAKVRDTRHDLGRWTVAQWGASIRPDGTILDNRPWYLRTIQLREVEKNWTPLPDGGTIYRYDQGLSVDRAGTLVKAPAVRMPWGTLWGGTPAIEWPERGTWLAIYHGSMPHPGRVKRYYFGAVEIDPRTHAVVRMSITPLVWASDDDETIPCPRDERYNPCVVFPAGLFRVDDGLFYVTGGVHDSRDALWAFTEEQLRLVPVSVAEKTTRETVEAGIAPPAGLCVAMVRRQPVFEGGVVYRAGDRFLTTPDRVAALGGLIEEINQPLPC